jgi:hypothetical protein
MVCQEGNDETVRAALLKNLDAGSVAKQSPND